jgi:enhancer of polycomb-like protein
VGVLYCMDTEDDAFLQALNLAVKKSPSKRMAQCSEDQFEEVMNFFEETSSSRQPFAAVDNAPVLTFSEMEKSFDETLDDAARMWAKDIYPHWKARRLEKSNHTLMATLKFERNVDADDSDPYVCFRRREVRQVRKTRARDTQTTEKLKKLRQELESARQILHYTKQRELGRRDQLSLDRQIFDHRAAVKDARRNLGIKADDTDLINQRPIERVPKGDANGGMRNPRPAGLIKELQEAGLHLLSEDRAKRESEVNNFIHDSMNRHKLWNQAFVDNTWRPITPPLESGPRNSFREAITEYLPTPPASSTEESKQQRGGTQESSKIPEQTIPFRYASPPIESATPGASFRRRIGRGGRMWIDRRGLSNKRKRDDSEADSVAQERAAFDNDSDDEADTWIMNSYDKFHMKHRVEFAIASTQQATHHQMSAENLRRMQELRMRQAAAGQNGMPNGMSPSQQRVAAAR